MISEKELQKERYDRFIREIWVKAVSEVRGMKIMGIEININNSDEILAAYWLLKNTSWIVEKNESS